MRNAFSILAAVLGFALFMGAIWTGCGAFLKNNDAYERGLATALADPTAAALLGAPVREGWFINGAIESDGATSRGSWVTRIRGEAASGTLTIAGFKSGGRWGVVSLTLTVDGVTYMYRPNEGFERADPSAVPDYDIL